MASASASPPSERTTSIGALWRRVALATLLAWGPMVLWHATTLAGLGPWSVRGTELFLLVVPLALLGALVAGFVVMLAPRRRDMALQVLVTCCVLLLTFVPALWLSNWLRMRGFARAGERAMPVVEAMERCFAATGAVPDTVEALVPQWLDRMPSRIPPLGVLSQATAGGDLGNNRWALVADVPSGFINWDVFVYLPDQQYPARGWGGWLQRLGNWAYVHE